MEKKNYRRTQLLELHIWLVMYDRIWISYMSEFTYSHTLKRVPEIMSVKNQTAWVWCVPESNKITVTKFKNNNFNLFKYNTGLLFQQQHAFVRNCNNNSWNKWLSWFLFQRFHKIVIVCGSFVRCGYVDIHETLLSAYVDVVEPVT